MRDVILGVNDGLVSTLLLVSAVVGGGLDATAVLLTGVAGAVAGMISMSVGEYIATKSQEEVFDAELKLETYHLEHFRDHERDQLSQMLGDMGLEGDDLSTVVRIIDGNDEAMMNMHKTIEFGIVDTERRRPVAAAVASGFLFLAGAIPSVIPFAIWDDTTIGLIVATVLTGIALFTVGAVKTLQTRMNPIFSGAENLAFGLVGGAIAFMVGRAFDHLIS